MKIIVATISYDGDNEALRNRILACWREWREQEFEVIASDGGSSAELKKRAKELGVILLKRPDSNVGTGVRQAISEAYNRGADAIIYTEADKSGPYGFQKYTSQIKAALKDSDIVIVGRTKESICTYPSFQQATEENLINKIYRDFVLDKTGANILDFCYGVRAFRKGAAHHFLNSNYLNWASVYDPILFAASAKMRFAEVSVQVQFASEKDETHDLNSRIYRLLQAHQIFEPIIVHTKGADSKKFFDRHLKSWQTGLDLVMKFHSNK